MGVLMLTWFAHVALEIVQSPNANIVDRDIATLIAEYTQLMSEMDAQMAQLDQHVDAQALAASMRVELDGQRQKSSPSASVGR